MFIVWFAFGTVAGGIAYFTDWDNHEGNVENALSLFVLGPVGFLLLALSIFIDSLE